VKGTLLYIVIACLLSFSFQERREMVVSENQVRKLIDKWNEVQGKGDSAKLARLYTKNEIIWNGKTATLSQLLEDKLTNFTTPVLKQDFLPKSLVLTGYTSRDGLIKCNFTLLRKIDGKVREYPYYLLLVKESGKLKITGEGQGELTDDSMLGLPMEIINVDIKELPEETLTVISGRSYFYPIITSVAVLILIAFYIIMKKTKTIRHT